MQRIAITILLLTFSPVSAENWDIEGFARCIADSGAKYYGAHWCPKCAKQNAMFGSYARYLPYIECAQRGSRKQLARCRHIEGYPTWVFPNGRTLRGARSFDSLSQNTGCQLQEKNYFID